MVGDLSLEAMLMLCCVLVLFEGTILSLGMRWVFICLEGEFPCSFGFAGKAEIKTNSKEGT